MNKFYYATVNEQDDIIEQWNTREEVKPIKDYHRIVMIPRVFSFSYSSLYEFMDIPF